MSSKSFVPLTKEESTKSGDQQSGPQTRVENVDRFKSLLHHYGQRFVDISESSHAWRVVVPLDCCVEVHYHERAWL